MADRIVKTDENSTFTLALGKTLTIVVDGIVYTAHAQAVDTSYAYRAYTDEQMHTEWHVGDPIEMTVRYILYPAR